MGNGQIGEKEAGGDLGGKTMIESFVGAKLGGGLDITLGGRVFLLLVETLGLGIGDVS